MTRKQNRPVAFSVRLPAEQVSRLDSLVKDRDRKENKTSRNAIVREAVGFYFHHQTDLVGSRRAITKDLEGKIDALDGKVETLAQRLEHFIEMLRTRRAGG